MSVDPPSGSFLGGYPLTITGSGFTGATSVNFSDGNSSSTVPLDGSDPGSSVVSDTIINVTAPVFVYAGLVHVTVTNPVCTSAPTSADEFNYLPAP
jgi:hypothetical protein